jgi:peptidoglycan/LPS O-acetylase OafA/YrhL
MKLIYRPEIDGLRAVAVIAVILYHAQITIFGYQLFKGGFVGVDVFFVISGYLITSIILKELIRTGSFSFQHFYERRIRRIIPVLLFIMLVSVPFAWQYLLPSSFIDFGKSIFFSLGISSNFYFFFSGQLYGDTNGLLKPFLHTWSLSVEEQYYVIFPIVLLITFKYLRAYLIYVLILGFLISLGLSDWGSRNYPSFNFYVLPTRAWELLAGSLMAYFEISNGHRSKNQRLNKILPFIGLALIGYSILNFNEMFHPSFYTLPPIIGSCLIIWFSNKDEIIQKILSTKLFVKIGLISYSLYLWHYPIFAFARVKIVELSLSTKIELIILTIFFSTLSYYFIEKPFRKKNFNFKKLIIIIFSTILLIIISISLISLDKQKQIIKRGDHGISDSSNELIGSGNKKFIIFGDSHAQSIMSYLKDITTSGKENFSFYNVTHSACISLPNLTNYYNPLNKKNHIRDSCKNLYKNINQIINLENQELIVVFYNNWFYEHIKRTDMKNSEDLFFDQNKKNNEKIIKVILSDVINLKKKNNISKKWIIIGKNPGSYNYKYNNFLRCYNSKKRYPNQPMHQVIGCEKKGLKEHGNSYFKNKLFKEIVNKDYSKDLIFIDNYEIFCQLQYCQNFTKKNQLIYWDRHHLSYEGSKPLVHKLLKVLDKIDNRN